MKKNYSLQRELNRWIIITAMLFVLVAGIAASAIAFYDARNLQDNMLRDIAHFVNDKELTTATNHAGTLAEETILIQRLDKKNPGNKFQIPDTLLDGLQTVSLAGVEWRVFVVSLSTSQHRYAIAQQTELRDEIALSSSLNVFLPIFILVIIMLFIIHFVISKSFKPLKKLSDSLDKLDATQPEPLAETALAEEIAPFVFSINALLSRIQQAMRKQSRFIADAAHELRSPVAALTIQAENLSRASSESVRLERQTVLQQGLDRLRQMINQLLDLARLQNEQESVDKPVSFNQLVEDVIADLYPLAEAGHIDLGMTRNDELMVTDQDNSLRQLVRNAIDNAIRYTPAGGKVDVSLTAEADKAVFCVCDTGKGIAEKELSHIIEPFVRGKDNVQTGSGLGLAICQEIAQRLGGEILLVNRPQGGLVFSYTQCLLRKDKKHKHA